MCVKWEAKVPTFAGSRFVFIRLVGRHFKHNRIRTKKPDTRKTRKYKEKYLSCQNGNFTE